jgi:hypothetical protein
MTHEQALNTIITAVEIAQQKGAYTLQDAARILSALAVLSPMKKEEAPVEELKEE